MPYSRSSRGPREEQHFRNTNFRREGDDEVQYAFYAKEDVEGYEDDEFM